jgi:HEPN domain-containing protein
MAKPKIGLDPLKIFLHARNFHKSYEMLLRAAVPKDATLADDKIVAIIGRPALMLSAFASELYLKCLICVETNSVPSTHNLDGLFKELRVSTRHELDDLWDYDIRNPGKLEIIEQARKMPGAEGIRLDLRYALEIGAESFVDLRYFYENEESYCLLQDFPVLLKKAVLKRFPSWESIPATPSIDLDH